MKRTILTGLLVLAVSLPGLMAQKKKKGDSAQDQSQPAQQQAHKGPAPKSKGELEALQALFNSQGNPDDVIKNAENLLTKYADTDFKDTALFMEADAYQRKGDVEKTQVYAERTLDANPHNYQASLLLGESLATHTRENDLDKEDKLTRADKYAASAMDSVNTAEKPNTQITDDQWTAYKKDMVAQAHNILGMTNLVRKKYDAAAGEFKTAVDTGSHVEPAYEVRLASAYQSAGKNDEAIAVCDKIAADPQAHPTIKNLANNIKAMANKAKAAGPGAGSTAPPQVEVKRP
jgi:tetratricopeptide (TPR) repeat protein